VITSTLLTLVVVPVLWSYLVRERRAGAPVASTAVHGGSGGGAFMPADRG
jgi:hypothetical protein